MTYEQFIVDFGRELKRLAVEPMFSMGELVLLLALVVNSLPHWLNGVIMFLWMVWRWTHDSDAARSAETACPAPVPKDQQARAERIAQTQPGIDHAD